MSTKDQALLTKPNTAVSNRIASWINPSYKKAVNRDILMISKFSSDSEGTHKMGASYNVFVGFGFRVETMLGWKKGFKGKEDFERKRRRFSKRHRLSFDENGKKDWRLFDLLRFLKKHLRGTKEAKRLEAIDRTLLPNQEILFHEHDGQCEYAQNNTSIGYFFIKSTFATAESEVLQIHKPNPSMARVFKALGRAKTWVVPSVDY
jgi:hypothetical protein